MDSRLKAFLSAKHLEVFQSVCHRHDVFLEDPLDASIIHQGARDEFERLLEQAATPPGLSSGRIMLVKGEAGAGKTHLMRALRTAAHQRGRGYFSYMQMTSSTDDYSQYILSNVIDSLDHPYTSASSSGLLRLSDALLDGDAPILGDMKELLLHADSIVGGLPKVVNLIVEALLKQPAFEKLDIDILRALLYLQGSDPRLRGRVLSWLRCEELSPEDRELLGGLVPRQRQSAEKTLAQLARVMWTFDSAAMIVCLDQLEDMASMRDSDNRFRRAMSTVCALADEIPTALILVSCLEDYYDGLREKLSRPLLDRIERNPAPITLIGNRSASEVEALVSARLEFLYENLDTPFYSREPIFPFTREHLSRWQNLRARDILDSCRVIREQAIQLQHLPSSAEAIRGEKDPSPVEPHEVASIEEAWNDLVSSSPSCLDDDDGALARLMATTIERSTFELDSGHRLCARAEGAHVLIDLFVSGQPSPIQRLRLALCNGRAQGNALFGQVDALTIQAKDRIPVAVRSSEFPSNPRTKIAERLGRFVRAGGRKAVIKESDWRAMRAMQPFIEQHGKKSGFSVWLAAEKPLSRLVGLKSALRFDEFPTIEGSPATLSSSSQRSSSAQNPPESGVRAADDARPSETSRRKALRMDSPLIIGSARELPNGPVAVEVNTFTRHAAFLGSTGSGKTTVAMHVIEGLLERGIPAILIDRKGDLSSYGFEESWKSPARDEAHAARHRSLREKLDVAVYTPGQTSGRPLAVPLAPHDLSTMGQHEQDQAVQCSAFSLASMLGQATAKQAKTQSAVLELAIRYLVQMGQPVSLQSLIRLVGEPPMGFINKLGLIGPGALRKIGPDLETLRVTSRQLLTDDGEQLQISRLFGLGEHARPGRTRLSIINTRFLGDRAFVLFFVSQLLASIVRWTAKNPSPQLQAVLFADEADLYLPANSKPCTKEPMQDLLRRARSAGLSVMLATQSPGDLDYTCRDNIQSWFIGRVREQTALSKMKPMLSESRLNIDAKISGQTTGEFFLLRDGTPTAFKATQSVVELVQRSEDEILECSRQRPDPTSGIRS